MVRQDAVRAGCGCIPQCVRHIMTEEEMKKMWKRIDTKKEKK